MTTTAPRIHLVLGPVGAGKSTLVHKFALELPAVPLVLDEWMATLFRPDRPTDDVWPWYIERTERYIEQMWTTTERVIDAQRDVILEIGLITRAARERFYARVDATTIPLDVVVVDAPRDVRRARVLARNTQQGATFSMVVPPEVFERASDMWEPPDDDECRRRRVVFRTT
jgi:predicted kinase